MEYFKIVVLFCLVRALREVNNDVLIREVWSDSSDGSGNGFDDLSEGENIRWKDIYIA